MNDLVKYVLMGIFVIAVLAIFYVFLNYINLPIPGWALTILWIIIIAGACAGAVKLLARLMNSP